MKTIIAIALMVSASMSYALSKYDTCVQISDVVKVIAIQRDNGIPASYSRKGLESNLDGYTNSLISKGMIDVDSLILAVYKAPEKTPQVLYKLMMNSCFKGD